MKKNEYTNSYKPKIISQKWMLMLHIFYDELLLKLYPWLLAALSIFPPTVLHLSMKIILFSYRLLLSIDIYQLIIYACVTWILLVVFFPKNKIGSSRLKTFIVRFFIKNILIKKILSEKNLFFENFGEIKIWKTNFVKLLF